MKTIKKIALVLALAIFTTAGLNAQSYKHAVKNAKRVVVENLLAEVTFEGYNGNEIVVEVSNFEAPPKRADGLKRIPRYRWTGICGWLHQWATFQSQ